MFKIPKKKRFSYFIKYFSITGESHLTYTVGFLRAISPVLVTETNKIFVEERVYVYIIYIFSKQVKVIVLGKFLYITEQLGCFHFVFAVA